MNQGGRRITLQAARAPAVTTPTPSTDTPQARFTALLHAHRGIVRKLAAVYGRTAADREDLAQDIAAELWRGFARYDPARPFSTWMYRIGLNVAISAARRTRPDSSALSLDAQQGDEPPLSAVLGGPDDAEQRADEARLRALHAVIERQSPLDRALLLLWLDDQSHRAIAEVLGISETNAATKLSRLRERLRVELRRDKELDPV